MLSDNSRSFIISYLTLRKLIGILGMALPFACLVWGSWLQSVAVKDSISAYYHTPMRDILEGLLIGVGIFLLSYKGYDKRDVVMAIASGIAGLGIAIFPCTPPSDHPGPVGVFLLTPPLAGYLHYGSSVIFFILLGVNSFFLFTLGDRQNRTRRKASRNLVYRICGIIIFASLATLGILTLTLGSENLQATIWTLFFETLMLESFGFSWLVKGETLLKDE